jgi:hypothetical protein
MDAQSQSAPAPGRPVGSLGARARRQKRRRELIAAFSSALGGDAALTEGQRVDIKKAAELTALSEDCRALAMSEGPGSPGALSALVRLESTASRAVRALRLPEPGAVANRVPLRERLRRGDAG